MTTVAARVSAKDIFDSLGREENNQISQRSAENLRSPGLERIMTTFKGIVLPVRHSMGTMNEDLIINTCHGAMNEAGLYDAPYLVKDIELFSIALNDSILDTQAKRYAAGAYISRLAWHVDCTADVKKLQRKPIIIRARHLTRSLAGIGRCMYLSEESPLIIEGDVEDVGEHMQKGIIEVRGNVISVGQNIQGGKIFINGDATYVGSHMYKGSIKILGDVKNLQDPSANRGGSVGRNASGGEIYIDGNVVGDVGCGLRGGNILIDGDVITEDIGRTPKSHYSDLGKSMESGSIHVRGNARIKVGHEMKCGYIGIEGEGGVERFVVGRNMTGGEIYVAGKECKISKETRGGIIYHKDRAIYGGEQLK